jgi:hypothetical protein
VKQDFFTRGYLKIGNGEGVCFLEDVWTGDLPQSQQYPSLYNIVEHNFFWSRLYPLIHLLIFPLEGV